MVRRPITPLTASVDVLRRQLGLARPETVEQLAAVWRSEVGDAIADLTEQVEVRRGALHITVNDPALVESLRWKAESLREALAAASHGMEWQEIVVHASRPDRNR